MSTAESLPGRRFQERYRRKRLKKESPWKRYAVAAAGALLALVGVFFLVVPGPGIPILVLGLALVAQESKTTARALDHAELRLRRWWRKLRR